MPLIDRTLDSVYSLLQPAFNDTILQYATYLFVFDDKKTTTITNYLAGLQNHLVMADVDLTVWSPKLHQAMKGYRREEATTLPLHLSIKFPFTNSMILTARDKILAPVLANNNPFLLDSIDAALCMGLMFLFRKSEYLTGPTGTPKKISNRVATLTAENTLLWYGEKSYTASCGSKLPHRPPDMISMFLEFSKGDQFGKGATRFFPAESTNPECMVRRVHKYIRQANLHALNPIFAGPRGVVSAKLVTNVIKATALHLGMDTRRASLHSLRIGGLCTLFAADVPDNLKQLAGRWASIKSFAAYARATMQQFGQIARALNNPNLVTADDIKRFYQHGRPERGA